MTKITIGTIIVLGSLPTVLLAGQNYCLSQEMLQRANSERAVPAASDIHVVARDLATPAESESVSQLAIDRSLSVDQPRLSMSELSNDNRSYADSHTEPSLELQTQRTIAGEFSADHSSLEELWHSNQSSDLSVSINSDTKANQDLRGNVHDLSRAPALDQ